VPIAPASDDTAMQKTTSALATRDLVFAYDDTPVINGVDLTIEPGSSIALMGPSGSGKSTLLLLLAGVLTADQGDVYYRGRSLSSMGEPERTRLRRQAFGFVFQRANLLPELSIIDNTLLGRWIDGDWTQSTVVNAERWLAAVGLDQFRDRFPDQLSGGQLQRAAIARALVAGPVAVFADEPTGALDRATGDQVMSTLLSSCRNNGATLIVVTHDPVVAAGCDRTISLLDGRIVDDTYRRPSSTVSASTGEMFQ